MSRFSRIFFSLTCRPSTRKRVCASAPAESMKISGNAIHSISHGPVERSWSSTIASRQRGDQLLHHRGLRGDVDRRNRIALLRHGRGRAAALVERLEDFFHLGLHHELHVEGDLAAGAGDQAEEAADLGDAVAHGVPGNVGLAELELLAEFGLHLEPVLAERGQRAGGAAEFAHQHARAQFLEALLVALEGAEQGGHLVAEGDRHRLLQIAAPGHRRIAILLGEPGQRVGDCRRSRSRRCRAPRGSA